MAEGLIYIPPSKNVGDSVHDINDNFEYLDKRIPAESVTFTDEMKEKLDGIEDNANNYKHPSFPSSHLKGFYLIAVNIDGHVTAVSQVTQEDITNLGIPSDDDLDAVISTIQDVYLKLNDSKVDKAVGMGLSANNFTDELKEKLDGLAVDADFSNPDTGNPVAGKTILAALNSKANNSDITAISNSITAMQNKLSGIDDEANKYVHPIYTSSYIGKISGTQQITPGTQFTLPWFHVDENGHVDLTGNSFFNIQHDDDKADADHTHNYAGSSSAGGSANSAEKLANAITINGVSFDGTSNITIKDSTKTDYTPSYTANNATGGAVKYYKLFTVTPTSNYTDGAYRFTVASRQGICEITYRIMSDNNLYINTKTTGSFTGSSGIASNIKTYFYKDTDNAITKMEVYCTIPAWDNVRFYKILHNNHYNTVAWDFKAVTALPTDFTSELALTNKNCLPLSGGTITGTLKTSSSGKLLYSSSDSASSPITISITNLFTNYTMAVCNIVTSSGKYSLTLPLQYIKSLGTSTYYEAEGLLFYYVDDDTMTIRTGLGQSNPTISSVKIINLL